MGGLMAGRVDNPGRTYHTMGAPTGGQSQGLDATVNTAAVGQQSVNSHLDSVFDASGWTRDDVMVVAAAIQLLAWAALLWVEVNR